jgi:dephospho-CoA kinase
MLAKMDPAGDYAVDSVRHPAEVEPLRRDGRPFLLLWVDADESVRFARMRARGRVGDPETLEELRTLEARELGSADPAAQQLNAVQDISDHVLKNDAGIDVLSAALDEVLASVITS